MVSTPCTDEEKVESLDDSLNLSFYNELEFHSDGPVENCECDL